MKSGDLALILLYPVILLYFLVIRSSFVTYSIANMWQPIAIVAGIAALVITGAFAYVSILHHQAKRKREEVERLIQDSHSIATIAQERIDELNTEQQNLQNLADSIDLKQKIDMRLKSGHYISLHGKFSENMLKFTYFF